MSVAYRVSWPDERLLCCTLGTLAETLKREKVHLTALIFVGPMLEEGRAEDSHLYAKSYTHRFRSGEPGA